MRLKMLLLKDENGDLHLKANYSLNYPFKMEGLEIIKVLEVPKRMKCCRSSRVIDTIHSQENKIEFLEKEIDERKQVIKFLKSLNTKTKDGGT